MNKKYVYTALMVSIILILTSCGKGKTGGDKVGVVKKGPVTITVSTFYEDVQADAYREIIGAFETKNQNIKVNLIADPVNYDERVEKALKDGRGADIMGLQRNDMIRYIEGGYLEDISAWVDSQGLKDKYYGVSLGYGKYDGIYYGIGDYPQPVLWFYNVDMFKKSKLEEPKNLEELVAASKKLKRYTQIPIMLGAKDPWVINTFFGMITAQTVNTDELINAFTSGDKSALESLKGVNEAIDALDDLVQSGALNKKVTGYDYAQSVNMFVNGKTAMLPMGAWAIGRIEKEKPKGFDYKTFENPVIFSEGQGSPYSATAVQVITVNKNSKYKEEAMKFITFLASEEAQRIFEQKVGISGLKSVNKAGEESIEDQIVLHLGSTDESSTMYMDNVPPKMADVTASGLVDLINGKLKVSNVWETVSEQSMLEESTQ